jgi:hypothetical protein
MKFSPDSNENNLASNAFILAFRNIKVKLIVSNEQDLVFSFASPGGLSSTIDL